MSEKLQYELTVSNKATGSGLRDTKQEIASLKAQVESLTEKVRVQEFATYDLDKALAKSSTTTKGAKLTQSQLDAQRLLAQRTIKQLTEMEAQHAAQANNAAKSTRNLGGATLALSQGFEDAQYGMRGVLNNIPGLIMMLGGGAGLAGVVSIAAVAFSIFYSKVEAAEKKAKEATATGNEMTEQMRALFEEVSKNNFGELISSMESLEEQERQLAEAGKTALEIEAFRSESLAKVSEALREAAALEIQLAEAQGKITAEAARAQMAALEGEAEAARTAAELALLDQKVDRSRLDYENQLAVIARLKDDEARILAERDRLQAQSQGVNREAQSLREIRDKGDGELPGPAARKLEALEAEVAGLDAAINETLEVLDSAKAKQQSEVQRAFGIANELDQALAEREIGAETIQQIADIAQGGAETALTTAAEKARSVLEEAQAEAIAKGEALGQESRVALDTLNSVLADGAVKAAELGRVQAAIEAVNSAREQADQKVLSAMASLEKSANGLLAKVSAQESRLNRLENQVNAINNRAR